MQESYAYSNFVIGRPGAWAVGVQIPAPSGCNAKNKTISLVYRGTEASNLPDYREKWNLFADPLSVPAAVKFGAQGIPLDSDGVNDWGTKTTPSQITDDEICRDGRKHLWLMTGTFRSVVFQPEDNSVKDLWIFHCTPYLETVRLNTTLKLPEYKVESCDHRDENPVINPDVNPKILAIPENNYEYVRRLTEARSHQTGPGRNTPRTPARYETSHSAPS